MKANELMVGDWVRVKAPYFKKNKAYRVVEVREHGYNGEATANIELPDEDEEASMTGEYIIGIPLTPEILEKNGFEKLDFSHFQIGDRRLVLDADGRWDGPLSWHWVVTEMGTNAKGQPVVLGYYVATINYVHQLQHVLRLCGIEKEIVI